MLTNHNKQWRVRSSASVYQRCSFGHSEMVYSPRYPKRNSIGWFRKGNNPAALRNMRYVRSFASLLAAWDELEHALGTKTIRTSLHVLNFLQFHLKWNKKKEARRKNDFKQVSNLSYIKNQLYSGQRLVLSFSYATRNAYCQQQFATESEMSSGNRTTMKSQAAIPYDTK